MSSVNSRVPMKFTRKTVPGSAAPPESPAQLNSAQTSAGTLRSARVDTRGLTQVGLDEVERLCLQSSPVDSYDPCPGGRQYPTCRRTYA